MPYPLCGINPTGAEAAMLTVDDLRYSIARDSFRYFVELTWPNYIPNRFHDVLCAKLQRFYERMIAGEAPKMLVTTPPRHGKSWIASQRFPVWVMGHHPDIEIIMASYSSRLASSHSERARALVLPDKKRGEMAIASKVFPDFRINENKTAIDYWKTTANGAYSAIGMLGSASGYGAGLLVIDDPLKGYEQARSETIREKIIETYSSDLFTRLAPMCGQLVILTRWHEEDLGGYLLANEGDEWEHINFPAIAEQDEYIDGELFRREGEALVPERYPVERLDKIRNHPHPSMRRTWAALYQQRPAPLDGDIIKREWLLTYDKPPEGAAVFMSWDMTFKDGENTDFVAGLVFAKQAGKIYLLDGIRKHMGFVETIDTMRMMLKRWPNIYKVIIEDKANGPAIIDSLRHEFRNIHSFNPGRNSKEERLQKASTNIQNGELLLPKANPLADKLIYELIAFPNAANDDLVDATVQAILVELSSNSLSDLYASL